MNATAQRIDPAIEPYDPGVQDWLTRVMPPGREPLMLFKVLARDARLFDRFFSAGLLDKGHLSLRQRELIIHKITALHGCEYEWGVHMAFFADKVGLTPAQRRSIVSGRSSDSCWEQSERPLLAMCEELHAKSRLSDEAWSELGARFSPEAILEMLMVAGFYTSVSYIANATRIPNESFAARFPA